MQGCLDVHVRGSSQNVMRHLQAAFALIPAIVSAAQAKPATVWQVRGTVTIESVSKGGIPASSTTWFTASGSNSCSRITTRSTSNKGIEFFEYSSDGENSKLLVKFTPSVFPPGHPRRPANEATLTLSLGTVPDMSGQITPVWLAYASGGFYKASKHGETEPVHFMGTGFREQHIKLKSQWRLRKEPPYLLQSMCDFSGGYQPSPETGRVIQTPYRNTNSCYTVSAWTNVAGLVLPLEWQLIRYKVNLDTGLVEIGSTKSGSVTNVEIGSANIDLPAVLPNNTRIVDYTLPT
jgi:hypothetical protein